MIQQNMYKNIFAITVLIAIAPWAASAAATFSSISVAADSLAAGATTTHTITFTTTEEIASGQGISFKYYLASSDIFEGGFDFSGASFTAGSGLSANISLAQDSFGVSTPNLLLNSALVAGTYSFTISGVVNTPFSGDFQPGMEIIIPGSVPAAVKGSTFTIGDESESSETNGVSEVSVTPTSLVAGEVTTYEVSFINRLAASAGSALNFAFLNSSGASVSFLTADATFSSEDFTATLAQNSGTDVWHITLDGELASGSQAYTFTLSNVTNPSLGEDNTYRFVISTFAIESGEYAESDALTITQESTTLDAPINLRAKKNKKSLTVLKWNAVDGATSYTARLMRDKGKRVATWKNLTTTKKAVPKKFIKAGRKYTFKVKACDASGCSAWSAVKPFSIKK